MKKAPAMPVYTKDFDTDERVLMMDLAEEGAYFRLLRLQWREGSIPADIPSIARILRVPPAQARRVWVKVGPCFKAHPEQAGRLVNGKTERVREEQAAYLKGKSDAGKKGASSRWQSHPPAIASPLAEACPSVAVSVPVAVPVPVPEQSSVSVLEGSHQQRMLDHQRQEYTHAVWAAFCEQAGYPPTRQASSNDWYVLKRWLDDAVPLQVVERAIRESSGKGHTLAYYRKQVEEAHQRWRQNLQVTA